MGGEVVGPRPSRSRSSADLDLETDRGVDISNIRFDAREDLGPWTRPGFDDADWPAAVELGRPPVSPWNARVPQIIS